MNEQEQVSQLSALFDGELPQQQAEMVIRRALREPAMRASWERYALIGACLRGEPLELHDGVADRVQARLASERELNVLPLPARSARGEASGGIRKSLLGRGVMGGAIAAGVALMSIILVRAMAPLAGDTDTLLAANELAEIIPAGYTTPGENAPAQRRMIDASLSHYLVAHSEEAASVLRSGYDPGAEGTELTEDQIIELR